MQTAFERAFGELGELCAHLGAPLWRVTHTEHWVVPAGGPAVRPFAESPEVIEHVRSVVMRVDEGAEDQCVLEFSPGLKLVCLRETLRRRKLAWIVAPAPIEGQVDLAKLAEAASLSLEQAGQIVAELHDVAVSDGEQALARVKFLAGVHARCVDSLVSADTIGQFTDQLTSAYEYLTMYHRIGRLMGHLDEPTLFIQTVLKELLSTTQFRWIAFLRAKGESGGIDRSNLAPFLAHSVDGLQFDAQELEVGIRAIWKQVVGSSTEPVILEHPPGFAPELGPEVVTVNLSDEDECMGLLALGARRGEDWAVSSHDTLPVQAVGACVAAYLRIIRHYQLERDSFLGTLGAFSTALDAKDPYTQGHSERVATLGKLLAENLGLGEAMSERVYVAGLVHDIGKIGVPESVLCGKTKLTDEEFSILKTHPEVGERILRGVPLLADALPGVLHHHERWDGKGYPSGIGGEEIPLVARILAVADTFDAMSSTRSYRPGQSRERVLEELRRCAGQQFDPDLVGAFLELDFGRYDAMLARAEPISSPLGRSQAA